MTRIPLVAGSVEFLGLVCGFIGAVKLAGAVGAHPSATHESDPLSLFFPARFKVGFVLLVVGFGLQALASVVILGRSLL